MEQEQLLKDAEPISPARSSSSMSGLSDFSLEEVTCEQIDSFLRGEPDDWEDDLSELSSSNSVIYMNEVK